MHPSNDNIAARSLSKMRQTRNVRKVKVNAQVTFVIYILETVANLSIFVVWFFVNHGNNNLTLTLSVLWFNVILPYTFLMNTSHNKNLVADDGWWNTIRNIFGLSENSVSSSYQNGASNITISKRFDTKSFQMSNPTASGTTLNVNHQKTFFAVTNEKILDDEGTKKVFFVSETTISNPTSKRNYGNPLNCLNQLPSTSNRKIDTSEQEMVLDICQLQQSIKRTTSDSDDEILDIPKKSPRLCIGEKILANMVSTINNEVVYIHYLNQLSILEEDFKKQHRAPDEFEISHVGETAIAKNLILNLVGKSLDRIEERKKILKGFEEHCSGEERYDTFLSDLFDLEESFIRT